MKREKYNDSLEEVFSERFNESPDASDAWSLPSDASWDAIAEQLPPERKKRRFFWWIWLGLGFLIVLASVVLLMGSQQHGNLPTETSSFSTSTTDKVEIQPSTFEKTEKNDATATIDKPITPTKKLTANTTKNGSPINTHNQHGISLVDTLTKQTIEKEITTRIASISSIAPLQSNTPLLLTENNVASPKINLPASDKKITASTPKTNIELAANMLLGTRQFNTAINGIDLVVEAANTTAYGVQIERTLGKNWLLGTGALYSKVQFDANYAFDFQYQETGEQLVAEGYAKSYEHNLPSLASNFQTDVVLVRSAGNDVSSNTAIPVELSLAHDVTYLSVPAYVQYQHRQKQWTYYVKSGISTDIRLKKLATQHLSTTSKHDAFQHHNSDVQEQNTTEGKRVSLNYLGAIGLQRHLNQQLYLYAEPTVHAALISTYPPLVAGQRKYVAVGLQMGFGVSF